MRVSSTSTPSGQLWTSSVYQSPLQRCIENGGCGVERRTCARVRLILNGHLFRAGNQPRSYINAQTHLDQEFAIWPPCNDTSASTCGSQSRRSLGVQADGSAGKSQPNNHQCTTLVAELCKSHSAHSASAHNPAPSTAAALTHLTQDPYPCTQTRSVASLVYFL